LPLLVVVGNELHNTKEDTEHFGQGCTVKKIIMSLHHWFHQWYILFCINIFTYVTVYLLHNYGYEISGIVRVYKFSVSGEFGAFYVIV